jgi:hypothetical protein
MSNEKHDRAYLKRLKSYRVPSVVTDEAIALYLESLSCPRALTVAMLYRYGEHLQLAELKFDPLWFNTLESLRDAYAATIFLSKAEFLETGLDLEARALEKFAKFEHSCRITNVFFRRLEYDPLFTGRIVWLHNEVARKISSILGDADYLGIALGSNWGPGSSTVIPKRYASSTNKFQFETGITRQLYDLIPGGSFEGLFPLWMSTFKPNWKEFQFEPGNKVITVAKDATANRVIAVEPGFNLWFQLGIGSYMRKCLFRFGIDLRFQSKNQELALLGSKTGKVATIDFSSASDSIAYWVIEELFPPQWLKVMNACRSHFGNLRGTYTRWEKFSSMGNGFTFEVESLIFFAIAKVVAEYLQIPLGESSGEFVNVYGDDVVIPTRCVDLFAEMCLFYGFTINTKKSHYASSFRESCGKHYYSGIEVTPIYLKSRLSTIPAVFRLANAIRRMAYRRNSFYSCDVKLKKVFDYLVSVCPKEFVFRIDEELGDGGFVSNWDEATPVRAKHGIEGYFVKHVTDNGKTVKSGALGLLLSHLWDLERKGLKTSLFRNRAIDDQTVTNQWGELEQNLSFPWLAQRLHPFLTFLRSEFIRKFAGGDRPEMNNDIPTPGKSRMKVVRSLVKRWHDLGPWL